MAAVALPGELWLEVVFHLADERDYKALVFGVPVLGRYVCASPSTVIARVKSHFGHTTYAVRGAFKAWYRNSLPHRRDGPASIERIGPNGRVRLHKWYRDGKLHRTDGPAYYTATDEDAALRFWYIDGKLMKVGLSGDRVYDVAWQVAHMSFEPGREVPLWIHPITSGRNRLSHLCASEAPGRYIRLILYEERSGRYGHIVRKGKDANAVFHPFRDPVSAPVAIYFGSTCVGHAFFQGSPTHASAAACAFAKHAASLETDDDRFELIKALASGDLPAHPLPDAVRDTTCRVAACSPEEPFVDDPYDGTYLDSSLEAPCVRLSENFTRAEFRALVRA